MSSGCKIGTRIQNFIGSPVADAAAARALPVDDLHRVDGAAFVKLDDSSLWAFDSASTAAAGDVALVPTAGSGRFLATSPVIKRTVTITSDDLTTAGVGPETESIGAVLPNTAVVVAYRLSLVDAFDNGGGASLTVEVGHSNDPDAYEDGFDAFTSSAYEGSGWVYVTPGPGIGVPAWDGTSVGQCTADFTAGADQLDNFTNGELTIEIIAIDLA